MNWTEVLGFVTGAACVWLAARQHVLNWPIGILNNVFFLILFWRAGLYADSLLQLVYAAIAIYGWWHWARGGPAGGALPASRTPARMAAILTALTVVATVVLYAILRRYTTSTVPAGDAITTAMSLTAQFMLGRKLVENWFVWIVA